MCSWDFCNTEHSYRTVIQVQPDFYEAFLDTDQNGKRWRRVQMKLEVAVWDSWQEAAHASDGERMSECVRDNMCHMSASRESPACLLSDLPGLVGQFGAAWLQMKTLKTQTHTAPASPLTQQLRIHTQAPAAAPWLGLPDPMPRGTRLCILAFTHPAACQFSPHA